MTDAQTQQEHCPNCTKFGLPILPLRYAVARNDEKVAEKAPELVDPFGNGVRDIALPDESARYTLRLLRSGYLYVFNEVRGEWKAYEVGEDSQLIEFDIRDRAPPPQTDEDESPAVCSRHGNPPMAKCVVIPDAANAGPVWFAFSDVAWTPAVLEHNRVQANREKHMHRIDAGAWVEGQGEAPQPHLASLSRVGELVAEYHFKPPTARPNTPEEIAEHEERNATLPESRRTVLLERVSVRPYPAFFHCLEAFRNCSPEAEQLIADAELAGERWGFPPAMVALGDPAGIAADLNELVKQRALEWAEEPERKKKHESALLIGAVREAVERGGELQTSERRRTVMAAMSVFFPASVGAAYGGSPDMRGRMRAIEAAGRIGEAELETIHANAWRKYERMYDEEARRQYLEQEYPAEQMAFEAAVVEPLDQAYLGWLGSETLKEYLRYNFDREDAASGVAYTGLLYTVLKDASGRKPVCDFLERCLEEDPTQPEAVLGRGLVFNQDELARQWMAVAAQGVEPGGGWDGVAGMLWDGINSVLAERLGAGIGEAMASLNNYAHEYSGVMVRRLQNLYDLSSGQLIASNADTRVMAILGALARHDAPDHALVTVRTRVSRLQAVRIMGNANEALLSPGRMPRPDHPDSMRQLFDPTGPRVHFQGVLLVERTQTTRLSGTLDLTPEGFEWQVNTTIRRLSRLEAGGHFVGALLAAFTVSSAWKDMRTIPGYKTTFGFGAGVATLTGGLMEGAGAAVRTTNWGGGRLAPRLGWSIARVSTRAEALGFAGRMIGTVGAVVSGALAVWEGVVEWNSSRNYAIGMIGLGLGMIAVGVLLFVGVIGGVVALVAAFVLALIMFVVGFLKNDEIQKWLDKAIDFGRHRDGVFPNIEAQFEALHALGQPEGRGD